MSRPTGRKIVAGTIDAADPKPRHQHPVFSFAGATQTDKRSTKTKTRKEKTKAQRATLTQSKLRSPDAPVALLQHHIDLVHRARVDLRGARQPEAERDIVQPRDAHGLAVDALEYGRHRRD